MGWADHAIERLQRGQHADIRPKGNSMLPRIQSGALVRLAPNTAPEELEKGDVVLVKVRGRVYCHQITAEDGQRVQIGNCRGGINGWVARGLIYGKAVLILQPGEVTA